MIKIGSDMCERTLIIIIIIFIIIIRKITISARACTCDGGRNAATGSATVNKNMSRGKYAKNVVSDEAARAGRSSSAAASEGEDARALYFRPRAFLAAP